MLKWTQRHIIRFTFNFEKTFVQLQEPLPYTPCVQRHADGAVWLLPAADTNEGVGRWLCVRAV
jgi:hypothetical protein